MRKFVLCAAALAAPMVAMSQGRGAAGAPVVTIRAAQPATYSWAVDTVPSFELGASGNAPELFAGVMTVLRQASGNVVVANTNPPELRVFDSNRRYVRTIGRKGQGPGEFEDISNAIARPGDSIAVLDRRLRRISTFSAEGRLTGTIPFSPPFATSPFNVRIYSLSDGSIVIGYAEAPSMEPSPKPVSVYEHVARYTSAGVQRNAVGRFFAGEFFLQTAPPTMGGRALWNRAFGRNGVVAVAGTSIYEGDASSFEIRRHAATGALAETIRIQEPMPPVTPADIARYKRDGVAQASADSRPVAERRVNEMPYPSSFPAYRRMLVDARERIWLEMYPYPVPTQNRWLIVDRAARTVQRVWLPMRFVPHVVGTSDILGVWTDGDGVERVRAYRLRQ